MQPVRAALLRAIAIAVALLAARCTSPATEVLVSLDTDAPSDRMLTVRASVHAGAGIDTDGGTFTWTRGGVLGGAQLPGSFGVTPGDTPENGTVTLVLDAVLDPAVAGDPPIQFRRIARFAFTPHATLHLPLFLAIDCGLATTGCTSVSSSACTVSIRCAEQGLTCGDLGACVSPDVTPTPLTDASAFDAIDAASEPTGSDALDVVQSSDARDARDAHDVLDAVDRTDATDHIVVGDVMLCPSGAADCNGFSADGCEVDLTSDPANCGACDHACPADEVCTSGMCACASGQISCGGQCVSPQSNQHCGNCSTVCGAGTACGATLQCECGHVGEPCCSPGGCVDANSICVSGKCVSCSAGQEPCCPNAPVCFTGGSCGNNVCSVGGCGYLGQTCCPTTTGGAPCGTIEGIQCGGANTCVCLPGYLPCIPGLAWCQNPQTDPTNCGACGVVCPGAANASGSCASGHCGITCYPNYADCDGNPSNGCEVDLLADAQHCGSCGTTCPAGQQCGNGSCAACGTAGGPCCPTEPHCPAFTQCDGATGVCVCGGLGQLCCGGTTCNDGAPCTSMRCPSCGYSGEPCCNNMCFGSTCRNMRCH